jgi:agmatine deiminase
LGTPREEGFVMPAEWAPHARCWMAWPCREEAFGDGLEAARRAYAEVAQAISQFEPVTMIARPELLAQASLYCGPGIAVLPLAQDDSWTRDTGPTFLVDGKGGLAGVTWRFNGWGEAYAEYGQDAQMARRVLEHLGVRRFVSRMVLEGGAIAVDGEGTCMVCTPSVLDPKRNPGITKGEAEAELTGFLGVEKVVWLPNGLVDDETGGHVDNVACFARPGVVLALSADDKADANYTRLTENLDVLRAATDAKGRTLEVLPVPQPKARARHDGRRLSLSYINFYVANGGVVMPAFQDAADQAAFKAVSAAFPGRQVVQVETLDILEGGGGIHCITQQEPDPAAVTSSAGAA